MCRKAFSDPVNHHTCVAATWLDRPWLDTCLQLMVSSGICGAVEERIGLAILPGATILLLDS